jgi:hypothetical protein
MTLWFPDGFVSQFSRTLNLELETLNCALSDGSFGKSLPFTPGPLSPLLGHWLRFAIFLSP